MMMDQQQIGPLAVIASLLAPSQAASKATRAAQGDQLPADTSWDEMVRWFGEQREWAELTATYAELNPDGAR
jgi:hypothetical protein